MSISESTRFGRVLTAMATSMDAKGQVDYDRTVELARWLIANGSDGLIVTGTTGEAPTLTDPEKISLWEAVAGAVTVPVIAGSGSNDTAHSIHMTKRAKEVGAAAALIVTPYYNRPPQSGVLSHFEVVAKATDLPIIIYDIPVRTGRKVESDTLLELIRRCSNVIGLKDAAGDLFSTSRLVPMLPDYFEVFSGDDGLTLPLLAIGAVGVIGVATHWAAFGYQSMISSFLSGDTVRAIKINQALIASVDFESKLDAPNPMPVKAMMNVLGLEVGEARLPLGDAPEYLRKEAQGVFDETNKGLSALGVQAAKPKKEIRV
ncbi:MAG: 4-hydroxy-tetrahydrodipicolinate synthase [Acidimicrobiaceae bacterium]|nr:4-hydroxy-tetrahydrodipicolinate synthase [Acidimicrobiaceae bacterium]